ncbi:ATP-binding protein [Polyangium sp. 6x1]|uniref:sensor histidine kinase n=1 Tax=Polyangium sp. 6x1 TaxID=3042689 RepID=UPI0024830493|nr:ATP-binding protein [Polyangium sp. 6x1]MDI1443526.1 ATP-binding protein [Polyangium sp. 6x1]
MNAPPPRAGTRGLVRSFVVLVAASVALQLASLMAVREISLRTEQRRLLASASDATRELLDRYESTTYLAVVGLSTSDWDLLLRQRKLAKQFEGELAQNLAALQLGGKAHIGGAEVSLLAEDDPATKERLAATEPLWGEVQKSAVRVLRSDHQSLRNNPDLERFQAATQRLAEALVTLDADISKRAGSDLRWLGQVQRALPVGTVALMLLLGAFVFRRILLPFDESMKDLARSEGALRVARDELERRVEERTAELSAANGELVGEREKLARANHELEAQREELVRANAALERQEEALRRSNEELERRVEERTAELREAQQRSLELARQAGMTEIASNVLHNVGNVLNHVNTSSAMLSERLRALRVEPILKAAEMLDAQKADLAGFFLKDERGRRLPEYFGKLGQNLAAERTELLSLVGALEEHVTHIRAIVDFQQSYATVTNLDEPVDLTAVLEDALRMAMASGGRGGVVVDRALSPLPRALCDKHKLLQIVLNLLANAKWALDERGGEGKRLSVRLARPAEDRVRIQVIDNGVGIDSALLTKIFQHGFTTRKGGHGFGLHSSALVARAMGGTLAAESEGPGRGAAFTLEFPFRPAEA